MGLIGGPVGVVVEALAGLGAGSLAAKWVDLGFSDEFLAGLQEHLSLGLLLWLFWWRAKGPIPCRKLWRERTA